MAEIAAPNKVSQGSYSILQFPDKLGTGRYPHYVMFFVNMNSNSALISDDILISDGGKARTSDTSAASKARKVVDATDRAAGGKGNSFKRTSGAIALYMPPGIRTSYNMEYDTAGANQLGNAIAGMASKMGESTGFGSAVLNALGAVAGGAKALVRAEAGAASNLVMSGDDKAIMGGVTGKVDNPRVEALFKSTQLRSHSFQFQFFPQSEEESYTIKKIIDVFKINMHPEMIDKVTDNQETGDLSGSYMVVPNQFDIEFHGPGATSSESTMVHKIATSVLESMSVDYSAGGQWLAYTGTSNPYCISIELQFKEIEPLTRQMVQDGF